MRARRTFDVNVRYCTDGSRHGGRDCDCQALFVGAKPFKGDFMTAGTLWKTLAARGGHVVASMRGNKRQDAKRAHKRELQQWENEGGNLAPAAEATEPLVTTGSA
jgi:hypothetical protein